MPVASPKNFFAAGVATGALAAVTVTAGSLIAPIVAALWAGFVSAATAQSPAAPRAPFTVSSSAFKDGGEVPLAYVAEASTTSRCGGGNMSPALAWSNPPAAAKSFAMIMLDTDGRQGAGVVHWIVYGVAAGKTSLAEGEGNKASSQFVGGLNNHNETGYLGPCPGVGDAPHHYLISVFALDLAPDVLPAGLSRDALMEKMKGHVVGLTSMVARYGR